MRSSTRRPRLHLIGHSFGARLLTSAVLGGVCPQSLTLLQAAFSAFAFAGEVPGSRHPGVYHRVLAHRLVAGRIVALRSTEDTALATLYPNFTGAAQGSRAGGRLTRRREVVAASAMGLVGARGVGAAEVEIRQAQRLGLPWSTSTPRRSPPPAGGPVMAALVSLDWRHGLVEARLAPDPTGGASLVLGHGADELVLRLSWDSLDALTLSCLTLERPAEPRRAQGPH